MIGIPGWGMCISSCSLADVYVSLGIVQDRGYICRCYLLWAFLQVLFIMRVQVFDASVFRDPLGDSVVGGFLAFYRLNYPMSRHLKVNWNSVHHQKAAPGNY